MCLSRCAIEEFKQSSDSWRSHAKTTATLRSEFAELLGDNQPAQSAQPAQIAQDQPEAAGSPSAAQPPPGHKAAAEAPKSRKAKKRASAQPSGPDASGLQHGDSAAPAKQLLEQPAAEGKCSKHGKRLKGVRASAVGGEPAVAEANGKHAQHGVAVDQELPKAAKRGRALAKSGAVSKTDSASLKQDANMSASCPAGGAVQALPDQTNAEKRKKQRLNPAVLKPQASGGRTEQARTGDSSSQNADVTGSAGMRKKLKTHKPKRV